MGILTEAEALINGERQVAYGDPKENLQRVASMWALYLMKKHGSSAALRLTPEDVCWMMVLLKMARQMHKADPENLRDAAGYIGLVEKVNG